MEDPDVPVDPVKWEAILPKLKNLRRLVIAPSIIPMSLAIIPRIRFHLISFRAITSVPPNWVDLLGAEPCSRLDVLVLHGNFHGHVPSSTQIRRLSAIKADPTIIGRFAAHHDRLADAWFFTSEPLASVTGTCARRTSRDSLDLAPASTPFVFLLRICFC
ncbi:hypothetical protein C8R45DRAFT_1027779 [Mycena sanguinolenta]|nr:hypothetical protein C8R45DRAFT_1027779 [Mycena sanguinolenta]